MTEEGRGSKPASHFFDMEKEPDSFGFFFVFPYGRSETGFREGRLSLFFENRKRQIGNRRNRSFETIESLVAKA